MAHTTAPQPKPNKDQKNYLYSQFKQHIRDHKNEVLIYIVCSILLGIAIRFCYPYGDLTTDTGGYIRWAIENRYGGTRPLGYSKFLDYVHSFSTSVFAVFFVQFIIYTLSQLFFFFTCSFFFNIQNRALRFVFLASNILFISGIYSTNTILSDNLFLSLTILLISFSFWFIRKPGIGLFISIVVTLLFCIMLRYIGLIYPAFILIAYFFALKKKWAFVATGVTALVLFFYVNKVMDGTEEDQNVRIFSAFGGWQKANNALHIIPHINLNKPLVESDDADIQLVDSVVRLTYPSFKSKYPGPDEVTYSFIWIDSLPLRPALYQRRLRTHEEHYTAWNYMGGVYSTYANDLIKTYPYEYFRYFILNNTKRLIHPDNEILDKYIFTGSPGKFEREWFEWQEEEKIEATNDAFRPILETTSTVYTILWFVFLVSIFIYLYLMYRKVIPLKSEQFLLGLILVTYILLYGSANVAAAPVNSRFLMPIRSCIVAFAIYCINNLIQYRIIQKQGKDNN